MQQPITRPAAVPGLPDRATPRADAEVTRVLPPLERDGVVDRRLEIADEVAGMAARIGEVDPRSADRLEDLAAALASADGLQRWSDVDLRRAFHTERLAHAYAVRREGGYASQAIAFADRVRNVLVLLPILLTWFALFEASRAYRTFLDASPESAGQSFLYLWEGRFGGQLSPIAPTFSAVALMDAILIGVIILLTFYAHGRRETREEKIDLTAGRFQADLDNTLAEAAVALAGDRGGRPALLARSVERLADRFDRSSQELLTRLRLEHDRLEQLAARREREFDDFGRFASSMREGAQRTHQLLVELGQVSGALQTALEDLTSEVSVSSDQGRALLAAVQGLERLTVSGIQSDQAVTRQIGAAAATLADTADKALAGAESAAQAARLATESSRGIVDLAQSLAGSQARIEAAVVAESESNTRLADALRGSVNGVATSTRLLGEIGAGLSGLRDDLARLAAHSEEQARTLGALLDEQTAIAGGMAEVAGNMSQISLMSTQRQEAVAKQVTDLVGRLDALADVLGRAATSVPSAAALERAFAGALRAELATQADQIAEALGREPAARRDRDPGRGWPQRRS